MKVREVVEKDRMGENSGKRIRDRNRGRKGEKREEKGVFRFIFTVTHIDHAYSEK